MDEENAIREWQEENGRGRRADRNGAGRTGGRSIKCNVCTGTNISNKRRKKLK